MVLLIRAVSTASCVTGVYKRVLTPSTRLSPLPCPAKKQSRFLCSGVSRIHVNLCLVAPCGCSSFTQARPSNIDLQGRRPEEEEEEAADRRRACSAACPFQGVDECTRTGAGVGAATTAISIHPSSCRLIHG